ncbi:hypothetical protein OIU74_009116 [Salix koriyanagi]|uniref:Uncharacterized protein n=1 Tax=Salix koriyanagi TaxID=2511006 RepID=A0A9Q0Z062_9ROSI|nr:hypothetical protein OIU74_009116 [Salix koriyanagi]
MANELESGIWIVIPGTGGGGGGYVDGWGGESVVGQGGRKSKPFQCQRRYQATVALPGINWQWQLTIEGIKVLSYRAFAWGSWGPRTWNCQKESKIIKAGISF